MATVPRRKPRTREVNIRALVYAVAGKEPDYPVYQFGRRTFYEKPTHNPFKDL